MFVALGAWQLSEVLGRLRLPERWRIGLLISIVLILSTENGYFYFGEYRRLDYFQDASGELALEAGMQLQQQGPNVALLMFGAPRVYSDFPTMSFINPINIKEDVPPEDAAMVALPPSQGTLFVSIPENTDALNIIMQRFPGGVFLPVPRKAVPGETLYYSYYLPPQ